MLGFMFCYAVLSYGPSSFATISLRKKERAGCFTLIVFLFYCGPVYVLYFFLTVPRVDLQSVIVVFAGHIPVHFEAQSLFAHVTARCNTCTFIRNRDLRSLWLSKAHKAENTLMEVRKLYR